MVSILTLLISWANVITSRPLRFFMTHPLFFLHSKQTVTLKQVFNGGEINFTPFYKFRKLSQAGLEMWFGKACIWHTWDSGFDSQCKQLSKLVQPSLVLATRIWWRVHQTHNRERELSDKKKSAENKRGGVYQMSHLEPKISQGPQAPELGTLEAHWRDPWRVGRSLIFFRD